MRKLLVLSIAIMIAMSFAVGIHAEDRYVYSNITVVAGTSSADRCLDKLVIWDLDEKAAATGTTVTVCDLANTWTAAAASNIKFKFFVPAARSFPIAVEIVTIINAATRHSVWFDNGIRIDAGTNTVAATFLLRRSSNGN